MKFKTIILSIIVSITFFSCKKEVAPATNTLYYFDIVRPQFSGNLAYKTTAFVEQFWRVVGNKGFNESVYKIASELEKAGYVLESKANPEDRLVYRIEKRPLENPTWEPVNASLTLVDNDQKILDFTTNRNMIYINSISTPEEGIIGDVVYIETPEEIESTDVKGKIVFAEMSPYKLYKKAIIDGGAIGLITYNNPSYLQPEKNTTSIQFRGFPQREKINAWGIALSYEAKEKLKSSLVNGMTKVKVDITTNIYPSEELTVVANIKGSELPEESLVFSAHIQEPGANDNATGVGTQLEMAALSAELITNNQLELKRTLTFLWGDEIVSTKRYVNEKEKRNPIIKWGISLDMVGENTDITGGSFLIEKMPDPSAIWTRGNDKHSEWGGKKLALEDMKPHYLNDFIIEIFKAQGDYANWEVNTNPFEGGSDHVPFLKADIPGLLLWHFTDQFYHTDNDRIDKVSQETMKNVGTAALVSAYTFLNANEETARHVLAVINFKAMKRLTDEVELSKAAIKKGAPIEEEIDIISAWSEWYLKALSSVEDMSSEPNEELKSAIASKQSTIKRVTQNLIKDLQSL
ncbi:M28 family peptidase [Aquimarina sp. 2201CG5-10]|uniref:M28 family peptidase n=1 Tax=Aquimarina callyspongiae TaxID=3098150 RepID=UPI002AB467B2|nr:M28 family peptidase [Aquimarina sp. 2201CG5-10]MDY8134087.1 M28 family peptidase [Aquimarina sp. 2201CG5-10]